MRAWLLPTPTPRWVWCRRWFGVCLLAAFVAYYLRHPAGPAAGSVERVVAGLAFLVYLLLVECGHRLDGSVRLTGQRLCIFDLRQRFWRVSLDRVSGYEIGPAGLVIHGRQSSGRLGPRLERAAPLLEALRVAVGGEPAEPSAAEPGGEPLSTARALGVPLLDRQYPAIWAAGLGAWVTVGGGGHWEAAAVMALLFGLLAVVYPRRRERADYTVELVADGLRARADGEWAFGQIPLDSLLAAWRVDSVWRVCTSYGDLELPAEEAASQQLLARLALPGDFRSRYVAAGGTVPADDEPSSAGVQV